MSRHDTQTHANTLTIKPILQYTYNTHKVKYNGHDKYRLLNYQISIKVSGSLSPKLHNRGNFHSSELDKISDIEKELGVVLKPVHPETNDPMLSPYFTVEVPDKPKAEQVINRLKGSGLIDSAYIKPDDEMPSAPI